MQNLITIKNFIRNLTRFFVQRNGTYFQNKPRIITVIT